jgi:hypothetical protein
MDYVNLVISMGCNRRCEAAPHNAAGTDNLAVRTNALDESFLSINWNLDIALLACKYMAYRPNAIPY